MSAPATTLASKPDDGAMVDAYVDALLAMPPAQPPAPPGRPSGDSMSTKQLRRVPSSQQPRTERRRAGVSA